MRSEIPNSWQSSSYTTAMTAVVLTLGLLGAMVAGYGAARGNLVVGVAAVALLGGILLSLFPVIVLWVALGVGLLGAGVAKLYVPALAEIRWLVVPLGAVLVMHVIFRGLASDRQGDAWQRGMVPILWWTAGVFSVAVLATLVNSPEPLQMIRGLKGYFQVWGVLLGLALLAWPDDLMRRRLPQFLLVVALFQLPFVVHQFLVLVPKRAAMHIDGLVPVDVIAGTFGAQVDGGGANSMLAAFMFVVLAGLTALWQKGVLSTRWLAGLGILLMAPMFVNGAKVSLVYALVLFLVLFGKELLNRPLRFISVGLVVTLALAVMLFAYSVGLENKRVNSWPDLVSDIYQTNFGVDHQARGTFTRGGALRYWAEQHIPGDLYGAVLGHGLYESRHDEGGVDLWNTSDPSLGIKNTAVSAILWDAGLLGLVAVFGLVIAGYLTAGRLSRRYGDDAWMAGLFLGARAAMAIIFVSLWVKSYFGYQIAYQTMLVVLLGWLAYWDRRKRVTSAPFDRSDSVLESLERYEQDIKKTGT